MKLYENFEKAYKLLVNEKDYNQPNEKDCDPESLGEDKLLDKMIKFYQDSEDYEKCSTLMKIKCWRYHQDKKYNL